MHTNSKSRRLPLLIALLIMLLPVTVRAGSHTVKVPLPNGVDDTAHIQGALDACVAYGPGCTVQLAAGTYFTKQVVVHNFQGTFKGMGMDITIIEALPNLPVNWPDQTVASCQPNLTTCLWPSLFEFVDGNISVSDLSIKATAIPPTQPWVYAGSSFNYLYEALGFTGQYPTDVSVDRIRVVSLPYSPDPYGYTVETSVHYSGDFPRTSAAYDYYFLSGSFTVQSSYFENVGFAISQDAFSKSSQITIGGSPSTGNHIENVFDGLDLEASEKSVFEISYNESSGSYAGMWVVPTWVPFLPSSPSSYSIHDNKFIGTGEGAYGMFLADELPPITSFIQAAVWNNTAEVQGILSQGIGVIYTKGTTVLNNTVAGSDGIDGIFLIDTTLDTVANNNVSGFTVDSASGLAQIYLDPSTTNDLVVCAEPSNTVLNQGTKNTIIGCHQSTASAEAASDTAPLATRPNLPRNKLQLPR